jgi:hypothetical protein
VIKVFLSHKKNFGAQAQALARVLHKIAPAADVFRSEDIEKGRDWRDAVNRALGEAKCFILLYSNPALDWSWCFFEAGAFVSHGRKPGPEQDLRNRGIQTWNQIKQVALVEDQKGAGDYPKTEQLLANLKAQRRISRTRAPAHRGVTCARWAETRNGCWRSRICVCSRTSCIRLRSRLPRPQRSRLTYYKQTRDPFKLDRILFSRNRCSVHLSRTK